LDNLFLLYGNFNTLIQKKEKKKKINEETKPTFGSSYLENAWHDLFEI